MSEKALTIEIDVNEIPNINYYNKVNIGEVMSKYGFSIVEHSNNEKLLMISNELIECENIIIGFACFDFEEINQISNELKKHNRLLNTVYIPNFVRIQQRKKKAYEEQEHWNNMLGTSGEEIEKNFNNFIIRLQEIKEGLKNTSIEVKEV